MTDEKINAEVTHGDNSSDMTNICLNNCELPKQVGIYVFSI